MASPAANAEAGAEAEAYSYAEPIDSAETHPDVEAPDTQDKSPQAPPPPPSEVGSHGCFGLSRTDNRRCARYVSSLPPC